MLENKYHISFENLENSVKNRIIMYTTARQFKNAIPIEEMLIIPSQLGDWTEYCKINLNGFSYKDIIKTYNIKDNSIINLSDNLFVTARGNKIISKQTPFIVNKAFSCELYLKFILTENNIKYKDLHGSNGHMLYKLYSRTSDDFKNKLELKMREKHFSNIDDKIKNISKAFINWRYIFENYSEIPALDFLFLNELCEYLDDVAKQIIYKNYKYDVTRDAR